MITIERLRELFSYNAETGVVTRKRNGRICGARGRQRNARQVREAK
jgi:hypothetical protein